MASEVRRIASQCFTVCTQRGQVFIVRDRPVAKQEDFRELWIILIDHRTVLRRAGVWCVVQRHSSYSAVVCILMYVLCLHAMRSRHTTRLWCLAQCSVSLCNTVLYNVTLRLVLPSRRKQTRSTSSRLIVGESTRALVLHESSAGRPTLVLQHLLLLGMMMMMMLSVRLKLRLR